MAIYKKNSCNPTLIPPIYFRHGRKKSFDFNLYGNFRKEGGVEIVKLHRFQIEEMPHHGHHMNFVFFGVCESYDSSIIETDEGEKLRWFSRKEILKEEMLDSVRSSALAALSAINF